MHVYAAAAAGGEVSREPEHLSFVTSIFPSVMTTEHPRNARFTARKKTVATPRPQGRLAIIGCDRMRTTCVIDSQLAAL